MLALYCVVDCRTDSPLYVSSVLVNDQYGPFANIPIIRYLGSTIGGSDIRYHGYDTSVYCVSDAVYVTVCVTLQSGIVLYRYFLCVVARSLCDNQLISAR